MDECNNNVVVIASNDYEKCLFVIARKAMDSDELEIDYIDKYAPTVEYLIRILRKAFGWMEQERATKEVINTRCAHNTEGNCSEPDTVTKTKCTEAIRCACDKYKAKYTQKFIVNTITIAKAGGIRGL